MKTYKTPFGEREFTEEDYRVRERQVATLVTSISHPDYGEFLDEYNLPDGNAPWDLRDYGHYLDSERMRQMTTAADVTAAQGEYDEAIDYMAEAAIDFCQSSGEELLGLADRGCSGAGALIGAFDWYTQAQEALNALLREH